MTEYIFFSGKGGVGKTTMAATTAVYQSGKSKRTLLVSTDPAGNLGDIFERKVGVEPILVAPNLSVAQMDSDAITDAYKNRMLEPLSAILDELALAQVKEEFNGGCTVEIATFDKFTDFLGDETYGLIVFDTAPTGHTLRLMTLPNEWDKYIKKSSEGSGQTCIGPVSQIEGARAKYAHAVDIMKDAARTKVYLVSRPEKTSVYETLRAHAELEKTGIHNFHVIINGIYPNHGATSGIFGKLAENQEIYIKELRSKFPGDNSEVPMQQSEVKGIGNIALLGQIAFEKKVADLQSGFAESKPFQGFAPAEILEKLLKKKSHSHIVILTGKGGVGKTVTACTVAMKLAGKGKTLLFTTDPAAHIGQVLETNVNHIPVNVSGNLWAVNIDQKEAVEEYRKKIIDDAKANGYTVDLISALEEELESPCTEEIAIFEQFANLLNEPTWEYFVLDTAPTGHTLRLLELPFEYKNQLDMKVKGNTNAAIAASTGVTNTKIENLINRLRNSDEATFLLVAYPEFTPLHESFRGMKDLERVGIHAQGVFLNHILNEQDCTDDFSKERWKLQQHYLYQANEIYHPKPLFAIPLQSSEIIGTKQVKALSKLIFKK
ncbi:Arsenical pump-driving ATPase TEMP [hydrothermal vent metagenome]|uniref:Arsenical pump-driving ATPase TEMP n=1 Tax=hydrothermal vent metagenome TaxID=652676 RepID=A0A3B0TRS0_9ZZZZ